MRTTSRPAATICLVAGIALGSLKGADSETPAPAPTGQETISAAIDVIVSQHASSPAPQQLALIAARSFLRHTKQPPRIELARHAWDLNSSEAISDFLQKLEMELPSFGGPLPWDRVLHELARHCQGHVAPARDAAVNESIASNLYVGIGIMVNLQDQYPTMGNVVAGGPADLAGAVKGDRILSIDGKNTKGWDLRKSIDALRGERGSQVKVQLQEPKKTGSRTYTITRDVVPFRSVEALEIGKLTDRDIGYAKISSIRSSTVHELRKLEREAVVKGVRAMILDLRRIPDARVHDTVLLTDALLDAGAAIGSTRSASGSAEYTAEADRLFRHMPLAVLIDPSINGAAEWLVAALKRHEAAILVGLTTSGHLVSRQSFPIPNSDRVINIPHILLEGPDGGVLATSADQERIAAAFLPSQLPPGSVPGSGIVPDVDFEQRRKPGQPRKNFSDQQFVDAAVAALREKLNRQTGR